VNAPRDPFAWSARLVELRGQGVRVGLLAQWSLGQRARPHGPRWEGDASLWPLNDEQRHWPGCQPRR
jgi:hypothetical protein